MNKNNLPQWKKDAVRVYMQEKFNKVTTENRASLFKLAQDYAPANIREVQPEQLDAVVEGMIIQSKLDTSQYNTRELEQLKTDLKKIIQDNVNDAVEADTRVRGQVWCGYCVKQGFLRSFEKWLEVSKSFKRI